MDSNFVQTNNQNVSPTPIVIGEQKKSRSYTNVKLVNIGLTATKLENNVCWLEDCLLLYRTQGNVCLASSVDFKAHATLLHLL